MWYETEQNLPFFISLILFLVSHSRGGYGCSSWECLSSVETKTHWLDAYHHMFSACCVGLDGGVPLEFNTAYQTTWCSDNILCFSDRNYPKPCGKLVCMSSHQTINSDWEDSIVHGNLLSWYAKDSIQWTFWQKFQIDPRNNKMDYIGGDFSRSTKQVANTT